MKPPWEMLSIRVGTALLCQCPCLLLILMCRPDEPVGIAGIVAAGLAGMAAACLFAQMVGREGGPQ
ncbi:MAG: hypothetical protein V4671_19475 [Armatimonadota bacterium]